MARLDDIASDFRERVSRWKDLEILVVLVLGVASLFFTAWGINSTHHWERQRYTASLLRDWDEGIKEHRDAIFELQPSLARGFVNENVVVPKHVAQGLDDSLKAYRQLQLDGACPSSVSDSSPTVDSEKCAGLAKRVAGRHALVAALNFMEYIAVSYEQNVVDRGVIREQLSPVFTLWFVVAREYIKASNPGREILYWRSYIRTVCRWNSRSASRKKLMVYCDEFLDVMESNRKARQAIAPSALPGP